MSHHHSDDDEGNWVVGVPALILFISSDILQALAIWLVTWLGFFAVGPPASALWVFLIGVALVVCVLLLTAWDRRRRSRIPDLRFDPRQRQPGQPGRSALARRRP